MSYILKVENLGKKYSIRHQGERERYVALRDVLARKATAPLRWIPEQSNAQRFLGVGARVSLIGRENTWGIWEHLADLSAFKLIGALDE